MPELENHDAVVARLNEALAWELRALVMYAHFATYVKGIHRLHLRPHFEREANEAMVHGAQVRDVIAQLDAVATTERDPAPIPQTTDYREMLAEALETERKAAEGYAAILEMLPDDQEIYDVLQQIYFAEERSAQELEQLII